MIGTTRPLVNYFMNKFRKLGFIKYNASIEINTSLLSVVLHDWPRARPSRPVCPIASGRYFRFLFLLPLQK